MKYRLIVLTLFTIVFIHSGNCQPTELEIRKKARTLPESEMVSECSQLLIDNYLYYAEILIDKLLLLQPQSSNYNYRKGFVVISSRKDAQEALPFLEKAILKTHKNYDIFSSLEQNAPLDAYFYLGKAYHLQGKIDLAIKNYTIFIDVSQKNSLSVADAQLAIQQCEVAKKLLERPKKVQIINMGDLINTSFPEYSPFISFDGSSLYFTSRRSWDEQSTEQYKDPALNQYHEDVYVSYYDGIDSNKWSKPVRLDFCEDEINEASISVSVDERRVFVYKDTKGNGDIFYTDFKNSSFKDVKPLNIPNLNTNDWETHCIMTVDGLNLYFVSNRAGGFGGKDIYRLVKLPDGNWSLPQNLGPTVNTPYDEDCPFIGLDNKTMYFSSNGPKSMGGYDILLSIRDENNVWQESINMGYPINSVDDDLFYTTTVDGSKGYITSQRQEGFGEKDIYEIKNDYLAADNLTVLKGRVRTVRNAPLPEDIVATLKNLSFTEKPDVVLYPRLRDGMFFSILSPCSEYDLILTSKDGKNELYREKFFTDCDKKFDEIKKEVLLYAEKEVLVPILKYQLKGVVEDKNTHGQVEGATVVIKSVLGKPFNDTIVSSATGEYEFFPFERNYFGDSAAFLITVSKDGFLTQEFEHKLILDTIVQVSVKQELERNAVGIDLAKVLHLNPIYYDLGKFDVRQDAILELEKIVKAMNDNPTIHVELGSHTDCRSSASFNLNLSAKRAQSSSAYIKARISNPERISGKGYGETKLKNKCACEGKKVSPCSEEQHAANRRTEFNVIKN